MIVHSSEIIFYPCLHTKHRMEGLLNSHSDFLSGSPFNGTFRIMTFPCRMLGRLFLLVGVIFAWGPSAYGKDCASCHASVDKLATSPTAHKPLQEGHCKWCHRNHGAANTLVLHAGGGRTLCEICHKQFRATANERPAHRFDDKKECITCHSPHDGGKSAS